jgi:dolichol-phosphate mannosyltransferase
VLPEMLRRAEEGADVVVGTRYAGSGAVGEGLSAVRERGSRLATRLSTMLTGVKLSDPMSGFFVIRRDVFEDVAPGLSSEGFKILLDIIVSATRFRQQSSRELKLAEVPYTFRAREAGESKMSAVVVLQFLGLLVSKFTWGILPTSFLLFGLVGATGVIVHMSVLFLCHENFGMGFTESQLAATLVAMTTNFFLNNELTYADKKLRGPRIWIGLLSFYAVCSIGTLANISVAQWIYSASPHLFLAGIAGVLMSVVFNYSVTRAFTWK